MIFSNAGTNFAFVWLRYEYNNVVIETDLVVLPFLPFFSIYIGESMIFSNGGTN